MNISPRGGGGTPYMWGGGGTPYRGGGTPYRGGGGIFPYTYVPQNAPLFDDFSLAGHLKNYHLLSIGPIKLHKFSR